MTTVVRPKQTAIAIVTATAAFITACSTSVSSEPETVIATESTNSATETSTEENAANSTEAAPATFDRNDPNFEFFNICEELTDEDLGAQDLQFEDFEGTRDLNKPYVSCPITEVKYLGYTTLTLMAMSGVSLDELQADTDPLDAVDATQVPGILTFQPTGDTSQSTCDAAVPTSGGMLWITHSVLRENVMTRPEICGEATKYLERVLKIVEDKR